MEPPPTSFRSPHFTLAILLAVGIASGAGGRMVWERVATRSPPPSQLSQQGTPLTQPQVEKDEESTALGLSTSTSLPAFFAGVQTATAAQIASIAQDLRADARRARDDALWALVVARWSQVDPTAMMAFVATHRPEVSAGLPAMAWQAWGASHPEDAFNAAASEPAGLRSAMLKGVAAVDPARAAGFALRMPDAQFALGAVMGELVREDQAAAIALLPRAIYDGAREPIHRAIVAKLVQSDPEEAMALARRTGRIWDDREAETLAAITRHHPQRAQDMVEAMPTSRAKALASVAVAKTLAANDPEAALAWTRTALTGPARDAALVEIAAVTGGADPVAGLGLVAESGWRAFASIYEIDGEHRETIHAASTASSLLRQWATQDQTSAQAWLEAHAPENLRTSLAAAAGLTP